MASSKESKTSYQQGFNDMGIVEKKPLWCSSAPSRPGLRTILIATAASVAALMILAALTVWTSKFFLIPPMAASMALVMGVPKLPLSQPRNVIGGQTVSAIVGVLVGLAGNSIWAAALAGGLALGAMMLMRMPHSPAAATAIVGVTTAGGWSFVGLAFAAATILVAVGVVANRVNSVKYPVYIW